MRNLFTIWSYIITFLPIGILANGEGVALLVPAYFSPASADWNRLAEASQRVPLIAIANVFNGPGSVARADYSEVINRLRTSGGQVLGYTYTQYGARPLETVKSEMSKWHEWYAVDGFFVDEMSNEVSTPRLNYYHALWQYARDLKSSYRVVGNPGTSTDEAYLTKPTADTLVTFESNTGYSARAPSAWTQRYPSSVFANLMYSVADNATFTNYLALANQRHVGFVYITDDGADGNPWNRLATYWDSEVSEVEALNRRATTNLFTSLSLVRGAAASSSATLAAKGSVGRQVLEQGTPLGVWEPVATNLTVDGLSRWVLPDLQLPANRFPRATTMRARDGPQASVPASFVSVVPAWMPAVQVRRRLTGMVNKSADAEELYDHIPLS